MSKTSKPKPKPQSLPLIKGGFVDSTFVRAYKAKNEAANEAQALAALAELVRTGKVTEGPRVGLYPGLPSYRFAD